jgi:hypothetical protein
MRHIILRATDATRGYSTFKSNVDFIGRSFLLLACAQFGVLFAGGAQTRRVESVLAFLQGSLWF